MKKNKKTKFKPSLSSNFQREEDTNTQDMVKRRTPKLPESQSLPSSQKSRFCPIFSGMALEKAQKVYSLTTQVGHMSCYHVIYICHIYSCPSTRQYLYCCTSNTGTRLAVSFLYVITCLSLLSSIHSSIHLSSHAPVGVQMHPLPPHTPSTHVLSAGIPLQNERQTESSESRYAFFAPRSVTYIGVCSLVLKYLEPGTKIRGRHM